MSEVQIRYDVPATLVAKSVPVDGERHGIAHIADAARRSIQGAGVRRSSTDERLVSFLQRERHMGPLEFIDYTFQVECPLFIAMQILRHRTVSYSMMSGRYCEMLPHFWAPAEPRAQHAQAMQCSGATLSKDAQEDALVYYQTAYEDAWTHYTHLLSLGISREQARAVLPESTYTQLWMKGNLRNWMHFIELRRATNAQGPVREIAQQVTREICRDLGNGSGQLLGLED